MLDSARWLVNRIADEYTTLFTGIHERWTARNGTPAMPLARMLAAATPHHLFYSVRALHPPSGPRCRTSSPAGSVSLMHPTPPPPRCSPATSWPLASAPSSRRPQPAWAAAVHHSPDIMLAATNPEAIRAGDYVAVLGELHTALRGHLKWADCRLRPRTFLARWVSSRAAAPSRTGVVTADTPCLCAHSISSAQMVFPHSVGRVPQRSAMAATR